MVSNKQSIKVINVFYVDMDFFTGYFLGIFRI